MSGAAVAPAKPTGESSKRYGACEVCGQWCTEVWLRAVGSDCVFGHEACVAAVRP